MVTLPWWVLLLIIAAVVIIVVVVVASSTATRLNRMHIRTDLARSSLEAALGRRAAVARASYPQLTAVVAKAEALPITASEPFPRADAENELTRHLLALRDDDSISEQLKIELYDVHTRVELARRFYNDAVSDTRALRERPLVKFFRLAGTAPIPEYFDMNSGIGPAAEAE